MLRQQLATKRVISWVRWMKLALQLCSTDLKGKLMMLNIKKIPAINMKNNVLYISSKLAAIIAPRAILYTMLIGTYILQSQLILNNYLNSPQEAIFIPTLIRSKKIVKQIITVIYRLNWLKAIAELLEACLQYRQKIEALYAILKSEKNIIVTTPCFRIVSTYDSKLANEHLYGFAPVFEIAC